MKKSRIILTALLMFTLSFCGLFSFGAYAKENYSLTVEYKHDEVILANVQFEIYKVASVNGTEIKPTSDFAKYPVDLSGINEENSMDIAYTLASYVSADNVKSYDKGKTDKTGKLNFPNNSQELTKGLYLVMGENVTVDGKTYSTKPFLIFLPNGNETAVKASPKSTEETKDEDEYQKIKVLKMWDDKNNSNRPNKIEVDLVKDGKVYDKAVLSEENQWRYTWDKLPNKGEWYVVERNVAEGYKVTVSFEGITFVVKNKLFETGEKTTETSSTTNTSADTTVTTTGNGGNTTEGATNEPNKPNLPQTGMLKWPIPCLACAGLILFVAGLIRNRRSESDDEK